MNKEDPLQWPRLPDEERINRYIHADKLYAGNHYDAFKIKGDRDFSTAYNRLRYIVGNFSKIVSNVMADMLFGENLTIEMNDQKTQKFIDSVVEQNDLFSQLWESAVSNSRRGDGVFKLRLGPLVKDSTTNTVIIEEVTPAKYFPVFDRSLPRYTPEQDVIAEIVKQASVTYLHKEIHEPGRIINEVYKYNPDNKKIISKEDPSVLDLPEEQDTKVDRSLIFHIPNVRDGSGFFGTSDYQDLESLFFALNNRMTKTDNILDKHSDPILAVPPGVLDENGKVRREALGMFEVDNQESGFNKPEYIVWNANLEAAEKQVDKLIDALWLFSEVAPATMGMDKDGAAESGKALKYRMIATIRKRNRKMRQYDNAIKYLLQTAQELAFAHGAKVEGLAPGPIEKPTLKWNDRIINDEAEAVEIATQRIDNGTWSRADAIADLDSVSPVEAKKKVAEIDKEHTTTAPPAPTNNQKGSGTGKADDDETEDSGE